MTDYTDAQIVLMRHYDVNSNGYIGTLEILTASNDKNSQIITIQQFNFLNNLWYNDISFIEIYAPHNYSDLNKNINIIITISETDKCYMIDIHKTIGIVLAISTSDHSDISEVDKNINMIMTYVSYIIVPYNIKSSIVYFQPICNVKILSAPNCTVQNLEKYNLIARIL